MSVFYNHEAERRLLGAIILDPSTLEICGNLLDDDFHAPHNRAIMAQIRALSHAGKPLDLITLSDAIRCNGGGATMAQVSEITDGTPSAANAPYYLEIVKDCSLRRAGWEKSSQMRDKLKEPGGSGAEVLSSVTSDIQAILDQGGGYEYRGAPQMVPDFVSYMADIKENWKAHEGIKSGLESLDSILYGFHQEFTVIGARPSIGKTSLIITLIENIVIRQKIAAGFFSIEMSERSLVTRLVSVGSSVWIGHIKTGYYASGEPERIEDYLNQVYDSKLFIDDDPGLTLDKLRIRARRMVRRDGVKIIFIDHFSLIKHQAKKGEKRYENFIEISAGLKQLTRELKIPIVLLCQLGRDSEGREPILSDLRETGSLEQDADIVMFLHRKRQSDMEQEMPEIPTDLVVVKNRDGKTGRARLLFVPNTTRFKDAPKEKGEGK